MNKLLIYLGTVALAFLMYYGYDLSQTSAVSWPVVIVVGVVIGIAVGLFTAMKLKARGTEQARVVGYGLLSGIAACGLAGVALIALNYHTATQAPAQQMRVVRLTHELRTYTRTGRRGLPRGQGQYTVYHMYVTPVDDATDTICLPIKRARYNDLHKGDTIDMHINKGWLGWPVYNYDN